MLTKENKVLDTLACVGFSNRIGLVSIEKNNIIKEYKASYVRKLHSWLFCVKNKKE